MFTGLIQSIGAVHDVDREGQGMRLVILAPDIDVQIGASVCVTGVCLTVSKKNDFLYSFDVLDVTTEKTTLGKLKIDDHLNLETSLKVGDELGGHFVYGHVDTMVAVSSSKIMHDDLILSFNMPSTFHECIVAQGSIAIDGVSLTISDVDENIFSVSIIPHTRSKTTLRHLSVGDMVNVEIDMLAKYAYQVIRK